MTTSGSPNLRAPDLDRTYVGEADGRTRVLLVESDPVLGLDIADALETAGLQAIGPLRRPAEVLSLLPSLSVQGVVLGQERWDAADRAVGRAILRRLRRRGVPVVVHADRPEEPGLAAELADIPVLSRPAWPGDVVAAVAAQLPPGGRP